MGEAMRKERKALRLDCVCLPTPNSLVEKTVKYLICNPHAQPTGPLPRVTFLDTPRMSSYLLALAVGRFDSIQAQTENLGSGSPSGLPYFEGKQSPRASCFEFVEVHAADLRLFQA